MDEPPHPDLNPDRGPERGPGPAPARPVAAFVVSLIAGLWMLAMGGMMGWGYMGGYGWMWRHHGMMHGYGGGAMWSWIGIVAGIVVITGAVVLYAVPSAARFWGVVIIVASAIDLLAGMGGFLAGSLGIVGGILAVTWQPQT